MRLYKYTSFKIGKDVIKSSQIALSQPHHFNDPFDCRVVKNDNELEKAINIINGYILDQQIFETLKTLKDKIKKHGQKALVSFALAEYKMIQCIYKKHSAPYYPICSFDKIIKKLDLCSRIGQATPELIEAKEKIIETQKQLKEKLWQSLNEMLDLRDRLYIGCLSATFDSILMWSYYGENHKGICIELEVEENPAYLFKVEYQEERPAMQLEKISSVFCGKLFAKQDMSNISKEMTLLPLVAQPYVTKAKGWEHEQEYRLIYSESDFDKTTIFKKKCADGVERYMYPAKITKIYLGATMPEDKKEEIRFISPKEIEIMEMKISDTKYALLS